MTGHQHNEDCYEEMRAERDQREHDANKAKWRASRALQASPGYDRVLAGALAPKHEPVIRLVGGRAYRVRCSCQRRGSGEVVVGRKAAYEAAWHIVDAHNRGEV